MICLILNNMDTKELDKTQGHWILAKMGKRVLRPGGKELTLKLLSNLHISSADSIVEFAPGIGFTAAKIIAQQPKSYIGIDADRDVVKLLSKKFKSNNNVNFKFASASDSGLESMSKDKVMGEAMLTMHNNERKSEIVREAHRILKQNGLYAIHELGLRNIDKDKLNEINKDLQLSIKVHARPLTEEEWKNLLIKKGFEIVRVFTNEMHLLEKKRIIDDEGFLRTLKIGYNILTNSKAKERILEMRTIFRKHKQHLNAVAIIARKIYRFGLLHA